MDRRRVKQYPNLLPAPNIYDLTVGKLIGRTRGLVLHLGRGGFDHPCLRLVTCRSRRVNNHRTPICAQKVPRIFLFLLVDPPILRRVPAEIRDIKDRATATKKIGRWDAPHHSADRMAVGCSRRRSSEVNSLSKCRNHHEFLDSNLLLVLNKGPCHLHLNFRPLRQHTRTTIMSTIVTRPQIARYRLQDSIQLLLHLSPASKAPSTASRALLHPRLRSRQAHRRRKSPESDRRWTSIGRTRMCLNYDQRR